MNTTPHPFPSAKILLADDDAPFRESLAAWLRAHGFETTCATNAGEATAQLRLSAFDALIADIHMPGNTGLELLEEVPKLADGLPVILLTGQPSVETAIRSVNLPVTAYFTKPPNLEELQATMHESILRYRRLRQVTANRETLRHWDDHLNGLIESIRKRRYHDDQAHMTDYLRVTLRSLLAQLASLEESVAAWSRTAQPATTHRELDLVGAIQRAIAVLRQTRQDFKSSKLADLRRELEELMARS